MNKKIYYNNKFLECGVSQLQSSQNQTIKIFDNNYSQKLKTCVDDFLDKSTNNSIQIDYNFEHVLNYFKANFSYIEAAGGFIENDQRYLFIHRLGKWDLPKGKLDVGETPEQAAVRECEEECAVTNLKIIKQLSSTFHIYPYKNDFALKQTFWFYMSTNHTKELVPQIDENIDQAKWFFENEVKNEIYNTTYLTIKEVILEALSLANAQK